MASVPTNRFQETKREFRVAGRETGTGFLHKTRGVILEVYDRDFFNNTTDLTGYGELPFFYSQDKSSIYVKVRLLGSDREVKEIYGRLGVDASVYYGLMGYIVGLPVFVNKRDAGGIGEVMIDYSRNKALTGVEPAIVSYNIGGVI